MGSGVSVENEQALPADASDITNINDARAEIARYRHMFRNLPSDLVLATKNVSHELKKSQREEYLSGQMEPLEDVGLNRSPAAKDVGLNHSSPTIVGVDSNRLMEFVSDSLKMLKKHTKRSSKAVVI